MSARPLIITGGAIVTPNGVIEDAEVVVEDGTIVTIDECDARQRPDGATLLDATGCWVTPGFIDVQINGGHGIDLTSAPAGADELARMLPRYGVTAFLPTIVSGAAEVRGTALRWWRERSGPSTSPGAVPLGLHFEGPMLAASRRGAHPNERLVSPTWAVVEGWSRSSGVFLVTLAPELPGALELIAELCRRGVVVAVGHTDCTSEQFAAAVAAGAQYVTHLFNAMRPFSHRDPGPIGATLGGDSVVAGLICDGIHVDPVAVRMAWRALGAERVNLVTDAVAVLGTRLDASRLGSVEVVLDEGGVRTADGVLAGSDLSLDQAVRNLVAFTGCAVADAIATVTATPARLLELPDRGRLEPGARADVTVLDEDLAVVATVVGGEVAWRS